MKHQVTKMVAAALIGSAVVMGGCATQTSKEAEKPAAAPVVDLNNSDFYEVRAEGRIYRFDDAKTYLEYLEVGETSYRKVYIGDGPNGETVVYGLTKADSKKTSGIAAIDMMAGTLPAADDFYGELMDEGRIYVFSTWNDMQEYRAVGEAIYRYTDIGAGPNGQTVVYVLNKSNKKEQPVALMDKFKAMHSK